MYPAKSDYRPDIDGLRAVAVLAVVFHHLSAPLVPGGYVGVDVFFVISGYLITGIVAREIEEGTFTFARFYERRARRIFPALFAVLAVTLLAGYALLLPSDYISTLRGALGTVFFASNIVFWREMAAGYFAATDASLNPLLHTWSLAVEEQFYVFFPLLLLACFHRARRYIIPILIGCALVTLAGAALLIKSKSVAVFFLSPFRAWELLTGSLLALGAVPALRSRMLREATAGVGLLAIFVACFAYDSKTTFPGFAALAPVLGTAAIIHAGAGGSNAVARILQWRPVVYVGLISYSLYLWHWPIIVFTRYIQFPQSPEALTLIELFIISLLVAHLSYLFIEKPFRYGKAVTRRFIFVSTTVCSVVLTVLPVIGLMRGGFSERFSPEVIELDAARSPQIPYINCEQSAPGAECTLGRQEGPATVLLWGDSHMLAWAPAWNAILANQGMRAILSFTSSCPPLLGVKNAAKEICPVQNNAVKDYLLVNPQIKTVVMSAYWSSYFNKDGPLSAQGREASTKGMQVAEVALAATLEWLQSQGRQVVLIGPVPVHGVNHPRLLAVEKAISVRFPRSTQADQKRKHAEFFTVVEDVLRKGAGVGFIDPIDWLCTPDCAVTQDNKPLYRDPHHLSAAGALALQPYLTTALSLQNAKNHQ